MLHDIITQMVYGSHLIVRRFLDSSQDLRPVLFESFLSVALHLSVGIAQLRNQNVEDDDDHDEEKHHH